MGRLFNRNARVSVSPAKGFFGDGAASVQISDLRIAFEVEKQGTKDPNTCTVSIWNLSKATRAEVQALPRRVQVDAGYDGDLERLFTGDLIWSESKLEGTEWITKLQIADGARAYAHARVNRSFKRGVTLGTALEVVAAQLGLTVPKAARAKPAMSTAFKAGISLHGPAQREMDRLLRPHGLAWSVQDGRLQILERDEVRGDVAIDVSQRSGLIGTPEFGSPPEKGKPPTLSAQMLLHPGLVPGGRVSVDAAAVRGVFKLERVTHTGDTWGDEWTSALEATEIKGARAA